MTRQAAPHYVPSGQRRGFWRRLGRIVVVALAVFGGLSIVGNGIGIFLLTRISSTDDLPDGDLILTVDLGAGVEELPTAGPFGLGGPTGLSLPTLVATLNDAATDPRVVAVAVDLGGAALGLGTAEELRLALGEVRLAGKPVYAYATTFGAIGNGTVPYYLASIADEVWMAPAGSVGLIGLMLEQPFFGNAVDWLGLEARVVQREAYKSAAEPMTRDGFSPAARESLQRLVDSFMETIVGAIAHDRGLDLDVVASLVDDPPQEPGQAIFTRLVDALGFRDQMDAEIAAQFPAASTVTYDDYRANRPEHETVAKVALVMAVGLVVDDGVGVPLDEPMVTPSTVGQALVDALEDNSIQAVVLRIDSPGGSYLASDAIWRQVVRLTEAGKPVIASMGDVAASGGYYIAMPADEIVAQAGTLTGSIGVIAGKPVIDEMTARIGITWDRVTVGENAAMFSYASDFTEAQWDAYNATLDRIYQDFVDKAAAGRGMEPDEMQQYAQGRVWSGADALERGLVDRIGGYGTAFDAVRDHLGLPQDAALEVVTLPEQPSALDMLLGLLQAPAPGVVTVMPSPSVAITLPAPAGALVEALTPPVGVLQLPYFRIGG